MQFYYVGTGCRTLICFSCAEADRTLIQLVRYSANKLFQIYYMEAILTWIADNQQMIYIVILMIFVGIEVIGRVPSVLHTPLMSGANAIHGVVIIGAIIVMGKAENDNYLALILGFLAVIVGTLNVEIGRAHV